MKLFIDNKTFRISKEKRNLRNSTAGIQTANVKQYKQVAIRRPVNELHKHGETIEKADILNKLSFAHQFHAYIKRILFSSRFRQDEDTITHAYCEFT